MEAGVGGRNLVLGYNCFAERPARPRRRRTTILMSQVRSEAERWTGRTPRGALAAGTLDDDAARFEYAKLKFDQRTRAGVGEARGRRGEVRLRRVRQWQARSFPGARLAAPVPGSAACNFR